MQHSTYPHEPGRLYDCPACEAECHCTPGTTPCVYCASHGHDHDASVSKARDLGAEHGTSAASWVTDGNTTAHTYRALLTGITTGDPAVLDTLPAADLSGQWADGYSSADLERDAGTCMDCASDAYDAYTEAFDQAVEADVERTCRTHLGMGE
jgi:hypothetical protein